jgi:hypothetical protein
MPVGRCLSFLALVVLLIVWVMTRQADPLAEVDYPAHSLRDQADIAVMMLMALLIGATALPLEHVRQHFSPAGIVLACVAGFAAMASVALILLDAQLFNGLVLEDSIAENASAGFLFLGSAMVAYSLFKPRLLPRRQRILHFSARLGLAAVLCLIALEEVSWFQRVLEFETPEWLAHQNVQRELNLHNTQTGLFENLYYLGVAALLVGGPVVVNLRLPSALERFVEPYAPQLPAFVLGAVACAINYDMWNQLQMQFVFSLALVVTLIISLDAFKRGDQTTGGALIWLLLCLVGTQIGLLAVGHVMVRPWDATELRESVIALSLFAYAWQIAPPQLLTSLTPVTNRGQVVNS